MFYTILDKPSKTGEMRETFMTHFMFGIAFPQITSSKSSGLGHMLTIVKGK